MSAYFTLVTNSSATNVTHTPCSYKMTLTLFHIKQLLSVLPCGGAEFKSWYGQHPEVIEKKI